MLLYFQMIENEEDRSKFEQLYDRYAGLMYHITKGYLANEQDREDAVQTACEALIKNIKKISQVDCPQTYGYIVNTIESKCIDILKRDSKQFEELDECIAGIEIELPEDDILADALSKLPAHYREILLLRFDCGFSTWELSDMLGLSRGNVQKQILRAKKALSKILREEGIQ